ncbi:hypothetical protein BGZ98_003070 [Dissophora globulifera]|nr:hypothetical protein BGZ98_003070 [Dissophora globulifera]
MGSQASKHDTAIETCLADFPDQERTYILNLFERLCKGQFGPGGQDGEGDKEHVSADDESIDPQNFNAYFGPLLPPTLLTCFRVTMQLHSMLYKSSDDSSANGAGSGSGAAGGGAAGGGVANKNRNRRSGLTRSTSVDSTSPISKYGWVVTIHRLSRTTIEEQAGLSFMLQTHDKSLESFVSNVARAVMAFWLAGDVGSWRDIPEEDADTTTEFLLTRHLDRNTTDDFEEELSRSDGTAAADSGPDKASQDWLEAAQKRDSQGRPSTKELSRVAFLNWYQRTVEYQIMFKILIHNLFLGPSTLAGAETSPSTQQRKRIKLKVEQENKLCQMNFIAPRFKGGIDVAPHFSRLLTVADFFQLRYALPTPSYNNASASYGSSKKQGSGTAGGSGSGNGGLEQSASEARPTPPLRLLFSSKTSGASFSTLLQKITFQGPTLIVMKDEDGYIFGAYADQDWEQGPKFYGTDRTFLFTIRPKFRIYQPSRINSNFQYLDYGTKTLPNGIGLGGQLRYFGLWLASDFHTGQSAAEPMCSTFQSPRLSKQQNFKLEEMEVWQVHPSQIDRDEAPKHSAMDAHPDAVALLEMANRKMYSKDVRAPENVYDSD